MRKGFKVQQRTPNSLNQSMTNGLPNLSPENMNLCISQFYRKRFTQRFQDSPDESRYNYKDVEQLSEEILQLKRDNLLLKQNNQQLVFQLRLDEREHSNRQVTSDSSECSNLQHQKLLDKLKQARLIIAQKNNEVDIVKKSARYTKLQEAENDLIKVRLQNEILQKQIQETLKSEEDKSKIERLTIKILELEDKLRHYNLTQQKQKRRHFLLRQELAQLTAALEKYKKLFHEKSDEFEAYKKINESDLNSKLKYKEQIEHLHIESDRQNQHMKEIRQEMEKQRQQLLQKQNQIKEIEEQYQQKKSYRANKKVADKRQQQILDEKIHINHNQYSKQETDSIVPQTTLELQQQQQQQSQQQQQQQQQYQQQQQQSLQKSQLQQKKSMEENMRLSNRISDESPKAGQERQQEQFSPMQSTKLIKENNNKPKPKLPRVNTVDVEYIGKILKLKFITNNIDFNTLDTYINGVDSTISIMELDRILSQYPFNIEENNQRLLIARYMVEDNSQPIIEYDVQLSNDTCIVKSVLKNMIGKYQLFTNEEEERLKQSITQQISKFRQSLYEQLKSVCQKKSSLKAEHCEVEDLRNALGFCNIMLENREKEYLQIVIYKFANGNTQFDYRSLLDKFV